MSHPKKPWEQAWQHGTQGRSGVVVRVDEPGRTTRVCDPWRAPGMSDEEQLAAADLISAAPEMYRAIEEILLAFDRGAIPYRTDVCEALDSAEAVLKEARGE